MKALGRWPGAFLIHPFHANCDCEYAIRFNSRTTVAGCDPDKYLRQYENAGGDIDLVTGKRMTIAAFPFRCEMADGGFVRLVAWEEGSF